MQIIGVGSWELFEPLLSSSDEMDARIIRGIIEAHQKGRSIQGVLEFRAVEPNREIIYNVRGQKAKIAVSREIALCLERAMRQKGRNC